MNGLDKNNWQLLLSAVATDSIVSSEFFFCADDNSLTAILYLIKFCVSMYLDNCSKPREFLSHRSKVKVTGPDFQILYHCEIWQKSLYRITHQPLLLDEILHTHVPRQFLEPYWISRSSVKGQGHMVCFVFFCVCDAAATCRQYFALSKARWSCL